MCRKLVCLLAAVCILGLASTAHADLIGWWTLNDGSGAVAKDSSGNGSDAAFSGSPVWVAGRLGGALQFDGTAAYLDCGNTTTLQVAGPLTIACWINPSVLSGERSFVGRTAEYTFKLNVDKLRFTTPGVLDHEGANSVVTLNTWQHVAVTFIPGQATDGLKFFINGVMTDQMTASAMNVGTGPFLIANNQWSQFFGGMIDDVQVYNEALPAEQIAKIMAGLQQGQATGPAPAEEATDVIRDATLAWTASESAATHDVYLGTSFADVNDAGRSNAMGTLVSQDQTGTTYEPAAALEYGQTYYWRVDEVNAAPDYTIFKGETWSFTVEPYGYPVAPIAATASSFQPGMGPENTINGSGLDGDDQHSTDLKHMWMTTGQAKPDWIQYEFDKVYTLDQMLVWNSNQAIESFLGFGAKGVAIEYSADGQTWTTLENAPEFAKATGTTTYTANTTVEFGDVAAKFVKLSINGNWGGAVPQTGLSEVRFFYTPVQAFRPEPADDATGVSVNTELNWRPGRQATSHAVSIGTDSNDVAAGTVASDGADGHSYTPASLSYGTTYFWKVDATGDAGTYAGEVWSFTTEEFATVEDFESYNDDDQRIYETWVDGLTDGASGSQVGYDASPFAETTIVHGGSQAMPLIYSNTSFAFSEAKRTFDSAQDWTARGVKTLSVHFAGAAGNTGTLYVKINNTKVVYDGDAADVARTGWQVWNIDLSAVGGNLAKVTSLTIGIEGSGAAGTLYVDDIRLSPKTREFTTPAEPDSSALIARWAFDGDAKDSSGKGRNGTVNGGAIFVPGFDGQAVNLDGSNDFVSVGSVGISGAAPRTICGWAKADTTTITDWTNLFGFTSTPDGVAAQSFDIDKMGGANTYCIHVYGWERNIMAIDLEWHHLAATYDGTTIAWYGDGVLVSSEAWVLDTQDNFQMGKRAHAAGGNFPGSIDEVRVYNKALSAEEIAWLAGRRLPIHKPL